MSKPLTGIDMAVRIVFLVLLGILTFVLGGLVIVFFVPISLWYIWQLQDRTKHLEERVAALEGPKKRDQASS